MEKKQNIFILIFKVLLIFVLFELFTRTIGSLLASTVYSSLLHGKYVVYSVSEFVVCLCAVILLFIRKKLYIFKKNKVSFKDSLKLCLPVVILSLLVFLANFTELVISDININNLLSLIVYTILIGLFEEIFFRGIIENELLENYSSTKKEVLISIIISGSIFGAVHLTNLLVGQDLLTTLMQFVQTTAIGILFGTIYYKTKNIWSLVFLHGFYDFAVLLSEANLVTSCGYVENVPISLTIYSLVSSLILSLIYLLYSVYLFSDSKTKLYNKGLYLLIAVFFINNIVFSFICPDANDYYVCPEYNSISLNSVETHYYGYNDFTYSLEDGTIYHVYEKNNKAILEDSLGSKTTFKIDNVDRVAVINNYLLIISGGNSNDTLYLKDLNDLNGDFQSFEVPFITSVGYLYSKDTNTKYPLIKSYVNDLFIIDDSALKVVNISISE